MSEWNRMRKQNRNLESMILIIIAACFLLGGWCDWNALVKEKAWIFINDIDAFSLTILQIQASTATLIIAIIALITGNISDSYMGVSVSDFYLNIKPWKLKQKMLIFMLLGFELIGALFHVLKLYNCVFGVFVATLAVILLSILEMYSAFEGRNKQNQDIEAYINYVLDSDTKIDCKLDVYQKFVLDWKRELDSQDKQGQVYLNCQLKYIFPATDANWSMYEKRCVEWIELIKSENIETVYYFSPTSHMVRLDGLTIRALNSQFIICMDEYKWIKIISCIKGKLACIQWFITTAISKCTLDIILRFSSILAKILVTPITMILNFIVMKGVVEKL